MLDDLIPSEKAIGFDAFSMTNTYATLYESGAVQKVAEMSRTYISTYSQIDGEIFEGFRGDVQLSRIGDGHWFGHFETLETWNNETNSWKTAEMTDGFMCIEFHVALEELTLYLDLNNDGFMSTVDNELRMSDVAEATADGNTF